MQIYQINILISRNVGIRYTDRVAWSEYERLVSGGAIEEAAANA